MVAAAEIVCEFLAGKGLGDLKGLTDREMLSALGTIDLDRSACVNSSISAARRAFADFRSRQIEEFRGEKALICTCFGVTEDRIEASIRESGLQTVAQVGDATNAGTGCGSCRMLIEEMLDGR
jgi:NifU-like protein